MKRKLRAVATLLPLLLLPLLILAACAPAGYATGTGPGDSAPVPAAASPAPASSSPAPLTQVPASAGELLLEVIEPEDGLETDAASVTVRGRTEPGAVVSVNEEFTTAGGSGEFTVVLSLDEGLNVIFVTASSEDGQEAELTLIVERL